MTSRHIDLLLPHEQEMFGTEAWSRRGYHEELADSRHRRYLVAEDGDGGLVGWAGVRVVADEAEILTVGVVPTARRRGIARLLLAGLLEHAVAAGARNVYLEVRIDNDAARTLYASEGFAELAVRRGYYDHGRIDAVVMHRAMPLQVTA